MLCGLEIAFFEKLEDSLFVSIKILYINEKELFDELNKITLVCQRKISKFVMEAPS